RDITHPEARGGRPPTRAPSPRRILAAGRGTPTEPWRGNDGELQIQKCKIGKRDVSAIHPSAAKGRLLRRRARTSIPSCAGDVSRWIDQTGLPMAWPFAEEPGVGGLEHE